jgi:sec-independent protein translocase protein TatB
MFGIGMTELLVILVVALVVLGPSRLPEVARTLGRALGELKRQSSDVFDEFQNVGREEPPPKRTPIPRKPANPPTPVAATSPSTAPAATTLDTATPTPGTPETPDDEAERAQRRRSGTTPGTDPA